LFFEPFLRPPVLGEPGLLPRFMAFYFPLKQISARASHPTPETAKRIPRHTLSFVSWIFCSVCASLLFKNSNSSA
jgi:hypothetical protein